MYIIHTILIYPHFELFFTKKFILFYFPLVSYYLNLKSVSVSVLKKLN